MNLTREHKKTLASILWGEKGMGTPKGSRSFMIFAADNIPGIEELVSNGYLDAEPNPLPQGSRTAYALTIKGRLAAKQIKISAEFQASGPKWRKGQLPS